MKRILHLFAAAVISQSIVGTISDSGSSFTDDEREQYQQSRQIQTIVYQYKVSQDFATKVVALSHKYSSPVFPKASDILAIIGIESSFRPNVKSGLKRDKAEGLTQIRPRVWRHMIKPGELTLIENQVKYGSSILRQYHMKLGSIDGAVNAYNVGLTAHNRGKVNPRYVRKYQETKLIML